MPVPQAGFHPWNRGDPGGSCFTLPPPGHLDRQREANVRRVLVGVKRVVDYNVRIRLKPDGSGVALDGVKMSINPFDEIGLEEALRIKERGHADEVVAVSIGADEVQQQLRTALAMGADRAIQVRTTAPVEPLQAARLFLELVGREQPLVVMLGKQAIDDDNSQTGQMLAALWDRPQATFASKIEINGNVAVVTREVDAGLEKIEVDLPAVFTTDLRLNEPRYVKLPEIMKAKKKPLDVIDAATLGVDLAPVLQVVRHDPPAQRTRGVMVKNAAELVAQLKARGVLS
jgi:electron transfer flavoprotein beta subunit